MNTPAPNSGGAVPEGLARSGSAWFADEVRPYEEQLKRHLRSSFPRVRDVDDVVQESYLRLWKTRAAEPILSARSLLFTIARRLALNLVRREKRSPFAVVSEYERANVQFEAPDGMAAAISAQEIEFLTAAIDSLPARCREVFILRRLQGVPQKEIAARLGLSEATVQVQAAKALRRCEEYVLRRSKGLS